MQEARPPANSPYVYYRLKVLPTVPESPGEEGSGAVSMLTFSIVPGCYSRTYPMGVMPISALHPLCRPRDYAGPAAECFSHQEVGVGGCGIEFEDTQVVVSSAVCHSWQSEEAKLFFLSIGFVSGNEPSAM